MSQSDGRPYNLNLSNGIMFPESLMNEIREKIAMIDKDPAGERIYFENAGGSLTLKSVCEISKAGSEVPDFPNRPTPGAQPLQEMITNGIKDAKLFFGAEKGSILCDLTVSKAIFTMTGVIMNSIQGTNVVTTDLDHPATYDSCKFFGDIFSKEVRSAKVNNKTGVTDINDVLEKIDKNTSLLSIIQASNITGVINDIETLVEEARKIKPDLYILLDCTQHIPHGIVNVDELGVDAAGFAPYKILGKRGLGIGWLSDRASRLPHPRFLEGQENDWDLGGYEPAGMAAITLIADYIVWIGSQFIDSSNRRELFVEGMQRIELHERALMYRLLNGSEDIKGVRAIDGIKTFYVDDLTKRDCILPISFESIDPVKATKEYVNRGVYVYHRSKSNKMSRRILDSSGMPSIVRVSPMHFNTMEEIDKFLRITLDITNTVV